MMETQRDLVLDAALPHVPFDGWSDRTLRAALTETGLPDAIGRALFPRGGVDLALAYHARGDVQMALRLAETDLTSLRFRDRIARAVHIRLELADQELVRRGTTLFALPQHVPDGARAVWATTDRIWTALGDSSQDVNWYSKRATLSAVYAATVLYWLGDTSSDHHATWDFLDRRIDGVMQIEKAKASFRDSALGKAFLAGPGKILATVRAPKLPDDLPGRFRG
jgi:ubiquinone biosynthesis protein COQ9